MTFHGGCSILNVTSTLYGKSCFVVASDIITSPGTHNELRLGLENAAKIETTRWTGPSTVNRIEQLRDKFCRELSFLQHRLATKTIRAIEIAS